MTAAVHAETLDERCPTCGAEPGQRCRTADGTRRVPCLARLRVADVEPIEQRVCSRCLQPAPQFVGPLCPHCAHPVEPPEDEEPLL